MRLATHKLTRRSHRLNALCLALVLMTCVMNGANARAENHVPGDYRMLEAGDKFDGVRQYAVAFKIRPPRRLRSKHLELTVGFITSGSADRAFVSFGPVWRLASRRETVFVNFGFSPTLISGSEFNGRDLGGNVHFTSSVSIGVSLGRRQAYSFSLRAQHTSNGGLSSANPGIDMFGLNFAFNFSG